MHACCYFNKLCGGGGGASPDAFLLRRALSGIQRVGHPRTPRAPITWHVLCRLLDALPSVARDSYSVVLLKAMFLLAFRCFLRVGEFTARGLTADATCRILQFGDAQFVRDGTVNAPLSLRITLRHFKATLLVPLSHCLYLLRLMAHRGSLPGPLFCWRSSAPVMRSEFSAHLNQALTTIGLAGANMRPHSFRIGAATSAAAAGVPDDQIQRLGRWISDAYRRYVRIPCLHSAL